MNMSNFIPQGNTRADQVRAGMMVYAPHARRYVRVAEPEPAPTQASLINMLENALRAAREGDVRAARHIAQAAISDAQAVESGSAGKLRLTSGMATWYVAPDEMVTVREA